jgi:urease accessory protein
MIAGAQLDLGFVRHGQRTLLGRKLFSWPFVLTRAHHIDPAPGHMLSVMLQTGAGAIHGEDRLVQRISVGAGAAAYVTSQGAASVHRAHSGDCTEEEVRLDVAPGGVLEYLPEPRILFPDAALDARVELAVAEGGMALVGDAFTLHDPGGGDRVFRSYRSEVLVRRPGGAPLAIDRFAINGLPMQVGGHRAFGSLYLVVDRDTETVLRMAAELTAALAEVDGLYGAASPLPAGLGLCIRFAAGELRALRAGTALTWRHLRRELFGVYPGPRPG